MKTIIAGCRDMGSIEMVRQAVYYSGFSISQVVSGCARGIDTCGELWARVENIPVKQFPADWDKHGSAAGPIRNRQMSEYAEALIAVWDGKSRGTKNMIETAKKKGLKVYVYLVEKKEARA